MKSLIMASPFQMIVRLNTTWAKEVLRFLLLEIDLPWKSSTETVDLPPTDLFLGQLSKGLAVNESSWY